MKKGLIVIGHFLLIGSIIVGIGINSENTETEKDIFTGELESGATIRVLENDTAIEQGYLTELLDAFNKEYAEYDIKAEDANMDQYTNLEQEGPYGFGPDVLYQANNVLMNYVEGNHILPLPTDSINDYDQIGDSSWQAFQKTIDNKTYTFGVPVNIQSSLLYYRKDMLPEDWTTKWDNDANNIPDMLESWSKMYQYSNTLYSDDNPNTWGYMRSFLEPYFSAGYLFSYGGYCFGENNTDTYDIGFSAGESYKGLSVIRQLASKMDERCIDDSITLTAYSELAKGHFFATMTTPDVYTLFADELYNEYGEDINIDDYLGVTNVPLLPKSGDLEDEDSELIPCKMMGGVHGYAISSYTDYPNASLAFVNFATQYSMIKRRNELLGIAPARQDVANDVGGLSEIINQNMEDGNISIMASNSEVDQIWTPLSTLFQDVAKDPYRLTSNQKYTDDASLKEALEKVDQQIYSAIHTLQ